MTGPNRFHYVPRISLVGDAGQVLAPTYVAEDSRDRARDIAVALEQELAHVNELVDAAAIKLRLLSAVGAIDISNWNAVAALVAWSERERP